MSEVGAPLVGLVADHYGPRWAMGVGALAGVLAALVGALQLQRDGVKEAPAGDNS